jgi:PAS domain-containing protein
LVNQPLSRFVFKKDRDVYYRHRKRLEVNQLQTCELRMMRKGGALFWARLEEAKVGSEGGTPITRVVISDITEQKRAEDEREAQKSLLDAVLESLPVGLALMDAQGSTMRANPEFERIWGGLPPVKTSFK